MALVDVRAINKPHKFSGAQDKWVDWRFVMENYLGCVDIGLANALDDASSSGTKIDWTDMTETHLNHATLLYAILASMVEGKALQIVKRCKLPGQKNGYEAWRLLVAEYEPKSDNRAMALVDSCNAGLMIDNSGDLTLYASGLMMWEAQVLEYETLTNEVYPERHRKAVLFKRAPPGLREHMQINSRDIKTSSDAHELITDYLTAKIEWASGQNGGIAPMDLGAYEKSCKWCQKGNRVRKATEKVIKAKEKAIMVRAKVKIVSTAPRELAGSTLLK
jgi:hypothetical protein